MVTQQKTYTVAEFQEFINRPENRDRFFELHNGEMIEMTPANGYSSVVTVQFAIHIGNFNNEHQLGWVTGSEGAYVIDEDTILTPDAAFISKGRLPEMPREGFIHAVPELVVEVVSPTDRITAVQRKAAVYLRAGTKIVWIGYPSERGVQVCKPAEDGDMVITNVGTDGVLSGKDILPGFTLKVSDVFP